MQAPIVLFVYNRIDHTQLVLQALDENIDADKSELFIFSDAPADETERQAVNKVREYIEEYSHNSSFKRVEIHYAQKNKGLSNSLIDGITGIINQYGRIIVLEDDHLTSPDFITFMNRALDYYEKDSKIWSISGFTPDLRILHKYRNDVYCGCRGGCWGWATWKDRFDKVDWEVKDYERFIRDKKAQRKFNRGGLDMTPLLKMQQEGKVNSWAIRWCYQEYLENMLTIFPRYSKVKNIGIDGSGTNSGNGNVFHAVLKQENSWNFNYNENDDGVFKKISKYYSMLYIRQLIGKLWYGLTEYEHCIAYRFGEYEERYKVLKPNFRKWFANPIPFSFNKKNYVFMEVFDKLKRKGYIGVSHLETNGRLTKPIKIIEEPFHISFPNVFTYEKQVYMVPDCSDTGQIRIYRMSNNDIETWSLYYAFDIKNIADIAVYEGKRAEIYFLASEINQDNPDQTRLLLFEIDELDDLKKIHIKVVWQQKDYNCSERNGGGFICQDGEWLRVAQHSTKNKYGKFITLNRVKKINADGLEEEIIRKVTLADIPVSLPSFIYRAWGTYTYGKVGTLETIDLLVQRFSVGGVFMKVYRHISSIIGN